MAGVAGAQAPAYPTKPVRMIIALAPGGGVDTTGRYLAQKMSEAWGQNVVTDNRPGAGGSIASEMVAKSPPDGYTMLMNSSGITITPSIMKLGYDPRKELLPVSLAVVSPGVLVVHPSLPVKNVQELIAYAKANPGKLNMASPGATTLTRLSGELFKQVAGIDWVTVHYKGGAPAMQDMLGGTAQIMFANISDVISQVKAGKLNAIAVTTPKRSAVVPDVPTLAESGFPDFSFATWQAIVGPAGLPREVVQRLNGEIVKAMATKEMKDRFLSFGTDAETSTPEELGRFLAAEVAKIRKIAQSVGATTN
jgi:tripartite-type tricarboxylate transporter receptor subunit TctC